MAAASATAMTTLTLPLPLSCLRPRVRLSMRPPRANAVSWNSSRTESGSSRTTSSAITSSGRNSIGGCQAARAQSSPGTASLAPGQEASLEGAGMRQRAGIAALALAALLLTSGVAPPSSRAAEDAPAAVSPTPDAAQSPYVQELLKRSKENKAKYDKERLDDYYRRNFKEYMDFLGGSFAARKDLSANDKAILDWIEKNKS